ncbi:transcription factor DIVARICATA-like [Daucus carota subsp. sativus]
MYEDHNSLEFFQHVAFLMPWKSIQAVQYHHQLLLNDITMIESSNFDFENAIEVGAKSEERKIVTRRQKKKAIPWTLAEHKCFLKGLQELGKGEWKNISKQYVTTRTPSQIASHAQKFEKRKDTTTPVEKRRASINDIQYA